VIGAGAAGFGGLAAGFGGMAAEYIFREVLLMNYEVWSKGEMIAEVRMILRIV
jgi:hypothetical protein